jgi:DNA-binding winged helix-turn-helix (wHTH) protein/pimeloyl-ACP methyl ester carboxylesterase
MPQTASRYQFGPFQLDAAEHRLLRNGVEVSLQPKAFEILCVLVENAGRLLKKENLLRQVWPDAVVEENNLNKNVSMLRKALGEHVTGQSYLETVPRVGYRFVAPVTKIGPPTVSRDGLAAGQLLGVIRFCTGRDGVRIAYSEVGSGAPLVRVGMWLNHLQLESESPVWRPWIAEFSRHHRLFRYDARGTGLSDRKVRELSFDTSIRDLEALVDTAGIERFALMGIHQGGAMCAAYAARHPARVSHLILYNAYARGWRHRGIANEASQREAAIALIRQGWGREHDSFRNLLTSMYLPDGTPEQREWFNEMQRLSAAPEIAAEIVAGWGAIDVTDVLADIRIQTTVFQSEDYSSAHFDEGRLLAAKIQGAEFIPLTTRNHLVWKGDAAWNRFSTEIGRFLGWGSSEPEDVTPAPGEHQQESRK